tara:strand:+ start:5482 stop:5697 length:216 start_codon:yes stop_codon:yes gene_type:complete
MSDEPLEAGHIDFISSQFYQLEPDELFWMNRERHQDMNPAHRKLDDQRAWDIVNEREITLTSTQRVYQKDY